MLFITACDLGSTYALFNLAYYFYFHGLGGCERDFGKAEELLRQSAASHAVECYKSELMEEAKTLLASMVERGLGGLDKNLEYAAQLYQEAVAEVGDQAAMEALGCMYQHGLAGLQKDMRKTIELYNLAQTPGSFAALEQLKLGSTFKES
ncbi:hypothetical protein HDU93_009617 [Gonapodya sp. JEL0774]|nr:hypothetical protein HDU93_009617 [Gonapodya sp. JEL0774]